MAKRKYTNPKKLPAKKLALLKVFREKLVAHNQIRLAFDKLVRAVADLGSEKVIVVVGPSGIGKTTLRHKVERYLLDVFQGSDGSSAHLPYLSVEAPASPKDTFDWSDCLYRLLLDANEPAIDDKSIPKHEKARLADYNLKGSGKDSYGVLQRAYENCLTHRAPLATLLDEAQHLAKATSGKKLFAHMDYVKDVANRTKTTHILFGTYDLLTIVHLSGQLARRSRIIHFHRYRADNKDEKAHFRSVLHSFEKHLPIPVAPGLVAHTALMMAGCLGCIGILKDWLVRALTEALFQDAKFITEKILIDTALDGNQLAQLDKEIYDGEQCLKPDPRYDLSNLGKRSQAKPTGQNSKAKKSTRKTRPGKRRPTRDPVGTK